MVNKMIVASLICVCWLPAYATNMHAEIRQKMQFSQHQKFSSDNEHLWLQRWLFSMQLDLSEQISLFTEPVFAFDSGRRGGSSAAEQNEGDVNQLYLVLHHEGSALTIGRQVLAFGNQRLIGKREGTNVRRRFDTLKLDTVYADTQITLYHAYHVNTELGAVNDSADKNWFVSGISQVWQHNVQRGTTVLSWHLLRYRDRRHQLNESRYAFEVNWQYAYDSLSTELEGIYQWGNWWQPEPQNKQQLQAYWLFSKASIVLHPNASAYLGASLASGDRDPTDTENTTFQPLFGKAPLYSEAGIFAPGNLYSYFAGMEWQLHTETALNLEFQSLNRQYRQDAIYSPGRNILLPAYQAESAHIANIITLRASVPWGQYLTFEIAASHLHAMHALSEYTGQRSSLFAEIGFNIRF